MFNMYTKVTTALGALLFSFLLVRGVNVRTAKSQWTLHCLLGLGRAKSLGNSTTLLAPTCSLVEPQMRHNGA